MNKLATATLLIALVFAWALLIGGACNPEPPIGGYDQTATFGAGALQTQIYFLDQEATIEP